MTVDIGYMQGRLCDQVEGKIQAFPWKDWETEFPVAKASNFRLMEWTLDHERLHENPLMTKAGRRRIGELSRQYSVKVGSLTGDLFMQAPFWKASGASREALLSEFDQVLEACATLGIRFVVVPLVDGGAMADQFEEDVVAKEMTQRTAMIRDAGLRIVFECDYLPRELVRFISRLPAQEFGINYDTGNSAALGYDSTEEIKAYGSRILNVHIKDRLLGGTTVPLGAGNADLPGTLARLVHSGYLGSYILQTARAADGDHAGVLERYRDMCAAWIEGASG